MGITTTIEDTSITSVINAEEMTHYSNRLTLWKVDTEDNTRSGSWCRDARFLPIDEGVLVFWNDDNGADQISHYTNGTFMSESRGVKYRNAEKNVEIKFTNTLSD